MLSSASAWLPPSGCGSASPPPDSAESAVGSEVLAGWVSALSVASSALSAAGPSPAWSSSSAVLGCSWAPLPRPRPRRPRRRLRRPPSSTGVSAAASVETGGVSAAEASPLGASGSSAARRVRRRRLPDSAVVSGSAGVGEEVSGAMNTTVEVGWRTGRMGRSAPAAWSGGSGGGANGETAAGGCGSSCRFEVACSPSPAAAAPADGTGFSAGSVAGAAGSVGAAAAGSAVDGASSSGAGCSA